MTLRWAVGTTVTLHVSVASLRRQSHFRADAVLNVALVSSGGQNKTKTGAYTSHNASRHHLFTKVPKPWWDVPHKRWQSSKKFTWNLKSLKKVGYGWFTLTVQMSGHKHSVTHCEPAGSLLRPGVYEPLNPSRLVNIHIPQRHRGHYYSPSTTIHEYPDPTEPNLWSDPLMDLRYQPKISVSHLTELSTTATWVTGFSNLRFKSQLLFNCVGADRSLLFVVLPPPHCLPPYIDEAQLYCVLPELQ